jgi:16S rRNA (guanine527-N7)-methyltransferase
LSARAAINQRPVRLPLGPTGFARVTSVSRETLERLTAYVDLLGQWNRRINLVSANTMGDIWRRHILDSAQLYPLLPPRTRILVDLGSGAGLPGLILAIMGIAEVHLVESDQRKSAFLREAIRITAAPAAVHAQRAETVAPFFADAVVARALADLSELIDITEKFRNTRTLCLFLKGKSAADELATARQSWDMNAETIPSVTEPGAAILKLAALKRRSPQVLSP